MLNKITPALFIIFILLFSTIAHSQDMLSGKWWNRPGVVKRINLNEDQIAQLDQAFKKSRLNLIKLKSLVEQEQFKLEIIVEDKNLDETAALEQYKRLEKTKVDLGIERFSFFMEVRKIVGYDTFMKLMAFRKARQQKKP